MGDLLLPFPCFPFKYFAESEKICNLAPNTKKDKEEMAKKAQFAAKQQEFKEKYL
jgi:hypothetical protein